MRKVNYRRILFLRKCGAEEDEDATYKRDEDKDLLMRGLIYSIL